jgi:cyclopropane-fatty-acyl-phospholipid synthase
MACAACRSASPQSVGTMPNSAPIHRVTFQPPHGDRSTLSEHIIPSVLPVLFPADGALNTLAALLAEADIRIGGERPWDMRINHPKAVEYILARGSLGLGESYMEGWWDCAQLDDFVARLLAARLDERVGSAVLLLQSVRARLFNLQSLRRAWRVGEAHYDIGNDFFEAMLDGRMAYTCGYWPSATTLDEAQLAKLDLVCAKLGLQPGMRLLDIGCGWGSLMRHAAERYQVSCVGLTISRAQAELGEQRCKGLPVEFRLVDYRDFAGDGKTAERFDRVASLGMFEHVGHKNHRAFFSVARRCLREDGLLLLHTIGKNRRGTATDPWIDRYIFPNGDLPSLGQVADASEDRFVIEDVHNFGADYEQTLLAWHERFEGAWPQFAAHYGERFRRMWRYYLLACAGSFRVRANQLWQIVLSPRGVPGGYRRSV